jgi:hypothetical protein
MRRSSYATGSPNRDATPFDLSENRATSIPHLAAALDSSSGSVSGAVTEGASSGRNPEWISYAAIRTGGFGCSA